MNISHNIIVNYFKSIVDNLNGLEGFFRMDLTEIQGSFRSSAKFPCLVMESHEGSFDNSNTTASVNARTFAFTIYDKPKHRNYEDQDAKLNTAEELGLKIIGRMRHEARKTDHFLYNKFDLSSVQYSKVGPIFQEQLYGYRFTGNIEGHESLKINPADWLDAPTVCNP